MWYVTDAFVLHLNAPECRLCLAAQIMCTTMTNLKSLTMATTVEHVAAVNAEAEWPYADPPSAGCTNLPAEISNLAALTSLKLIGNSSMTELQTTISALTRCNPLLLQDLPRIIS